MLKGANDLSATILWNDGKCFCTLVGSEKWGPESMGDLALLAFVDGRRIPLWMVDGEARRLYTENTQLASLLEGLAQTDLGLLCSNNEGFQIFIYVYEEYVYAVPLSFHKGLGSHIAMKPDPDETLVFLSPLDESISLSAKERHAEALDRALQRPRSKIGFVMPRLKRAATASFPLFQRERSASATSGVAKDSPAPTDPPSAPIDARDAARKEAVGRVVMSGLRLRGLTSKDEDYKLLYQHTTRAALFALRKEAVDHAPAMTEMQEIVERLLSVFM